MAEPSLHGWIYASPGKGQAGEIARQLHSALFPARLHRAIRGEIFHRPLLGFGFGGLLALAPLQIPEQFVD